MKNLTILIVAAAFITGSVAVAHADGVADPRSLTVHYADLDPASIAGAAVLYRRLESAARSVCRDLEPGKELARGPAYAECLRNALGNAVVNVDFPAVTAYAEAHGMPAGRSTFKVAENNR